MEWRDTDTADMEKVNDSMVHDIYIHHSSIKKNIYKLQYIIYIYNCIYINDTCVILSYILFLNPSGGNNQKSTRGQHEDSMLRLLGNLLAP